MVQHYHHPVGPVDVTVVIKVFVAIGALRIQVRQFTLLQATKSIQNKENPYPPSVNTRKYAQNR